MQLNRAGFITLLAVLFSFSVTTVNAAVPNDKISGKIVIDGSSTVYPITEAVAEEFGKVHSDVKVTVGISGTGGGFKKFCAKETDISNASRPIKETEIELCSRNGVQYIELPVAFDALSVVINPKNNWVDSLTVGELKKMWEPEAQNKITRWNQIRPDWPEKPIQLFGPGTDSGTYDYFTEAINGKEDASRGDFTSSEDDNTLVQGVAGEMGALGYFGLAYYLENKDKLKAVPIDSGNGPVSPTPENVIKGTYKPLSRPLFIYVAKSAADRPEVRVFVEYYLTNVAGLLKEVGYVELPANAYVMARRRFDMRTIGTMFAGNGPQVGLTIEELLARES